MQSYFNFKTDSDERLCELYIKLGIQGDYTLKEFVKAELSERGITPEKVTIVGRFKKETQTKIDTVSVDLNFKLK
jgi:hypothetical protein